MNSERDQITEELTYLGYILLADVENGVLRGGTIGDIEGKDV